MCDDCVGCRVLTTATGREYCLSVDRSRDCIMWADSRARGFQVPVDGYGWLWRIVEGYGGWCSLFWAG